MTDERIVHHFFPGRPALMNAERSAHWREHRERTRVTRTEAMYAFRKEAMTNGSMAMVKVDVYPSYGDNRLPDTGSCLPAAKAIIDGAVDADLIPHDGPQVVTHLAFHRPKVDADLGDGVFITFTELEEDSPWAT